jgi:hypothetical protein
VGTTEKRKVVDIGAVRVGVEALRALDAESAASKSTDTIADKHAAVKAMVAARRVKKNA